MVLERESTPSTLDFPLSPVEAKAMAKVEPILYKTLAIHTLRLGTKAAPDFNILCHDLRVILKEGLLPGYVTGISNDDAIWWEVQRVGDRFNSDVVPVIPPEEIFSFVLGNLPCRDRETISSFCGMRLTSGISFILCREFGYDDYILREKKAYHNISALQIKGLVILGPFLIEFKLSRKVVRALRKNAIDRLSDAKKSSKVLRTMQQIESLLENDDGDFLFGLGLTREEVKKIVDIVRRSSYPVPVYLDSGNLIWPEELSFEQVVEYSLKERNDA